MEVTRIRWCNSHVGWERRRLSETEYDRPVNSPAAGARAPIWRADPCTYKQNFDEGDSFWDDVDGDELSRSFSARFAVPSRIIFDFDENSKSTIVLDQSILNGVQFESLMD